jgi:hypothetical protein
MADGLAGHQWFSLGKKINKYMAIRAWFITGAARGIGARRSQRRHWLTGDQVVASDRKPEAVTEALGTYL